METTANTPTENLAPSGPALTRIAVGVDGFPEGNDAVALGSALARVAQADLMLIAVRVVPVLPSGMDWTILAQQTEAALAETRDSLAPGAKIDVETDLSLPRALQGVVRREHQDLLVLGSSRHAPDDHVRIGKRTRQLLYHCQCSLAVAPRGLQKRGEPNFRRIGVGYDGGPEADAALTLAGSLALAAGAQLHVYCVVDDRLPPIGWSAFAKGGAEMPIWEDAVMAQMDRLCEQARTTARATGANTYTEIQRGRPAGTLVSLSREVDLLVIGSRRWGPMARLLFGSTGEALLHDASCPVLVVPRPPA